LLAEDPPVTRRTARDFSVALAFAVVCTAVLTWPLLPRISTHARAQSGDGLWSIWSVAWVARTLVADPGRLFHANIFYPHERTLAFSEPNFGAGVVAAPAYWISGSPVLAHNSVLFLAFVAASLGGYALARRVAGSHEAGLVAGLLFAFCPYMFARLPHIQLLATAVLPFSLLALHRFVDRPNAARAVQMGGVLAAAGLCCGYYGLFAGISVAAGAIYFAVTRRLWRSASYWLLLALSAAVTGAVVGPPLAVYVAVEKGEGFGRTLDSARAWAADGASWLASAAHGHTWMLAFLDSWADVLFPGYLLIVLAGATCWAALRGRNDAGLASEPPDRTRFREAVGFYSLLAVAAAWASFGPRAGFYSLLYFTVPGFSLLRVPSRFGIVVALALSVLAAFAVRRLVTARGRQWAYALLAVGLLDVNTAPLDLREVPRPTAVHRALAALPDGPVVELPFYSARSDFPRHAYYMLMSTAHWRPLINGYSDFIPLDFRRDARALSGFPGMESFRLLERRGARYVIFHFNHFHHRQRELHEERLKRYSPYLTALARDGDVWLYEITAWPR
jgi:hypothetical protein